MTMIPGRHKYRIIDMIIKNVKIIIYGRKNPKGLHRL